MQAVLLESRSNILHAFPEIFHASRRQLLGEFMLGRASDVLDDVEVRRVGWPLKNNKLLLGKRLLYDVCCMNPRVVLLKDRFRRIHAAPNE
jgi:hypothetical protein